MLVFVGFNLTFFPQYLLGIAGHAAALPRVSAGVPDPQRAVVGRRGAFWRVGYLLPFFYLAWSLRHGERAGPTRGMRADSNGRPLRRRPLAISRSRREAADEPYDYAPPSHVKVTS